MHSITAFYLYEIAPDPLLLDAVRALNDPKTPKNVAKTVKKYVENTYFSYLTLVQNGDIYLPYGLRIDQFGPSDQ